MNKKVMFIVMFLALVFVAIQPVAAMPNQAVTVPTPKAPSGVIRDTTPTYEWNRIVSASEYKIQVFKKNSTVYTITVIGDEVCSEYKCEVTPSIFNFQGINSIYLLGPGAYTWRIQAKVGGVWKAYSLARAFSYATVPESRYPSGLIGVDTPQFSFSYIVGGIKYQIELQKGHKPFYVQTFSDAHCDEYGYCAITPSTVLSNGKYQWRIRSFVEGVWKGFSAWHEFELVNHVTVFVPEDSFQMGCDPTHNMGLDCDIDEFLHSVFLSSFYIDKYEVTNKRYSECVLDSYCSNPDDYSSVSHGSYYGNPAFANYPVINVSWDDAAAFCSWSGGSLPTEAQWEKAARGTSPRAYPWGDSPTLCAKANIMGCNDDTTQVGNHPSGASKYGAMDMTGNVWEWTYDWYSPIYYNIPGVTWFNPLGPAWEIGMYKVTRGGAYDSHWTDGFTHNRNSNNSEFSGWTQGFRCVYQP